MNGPVLLKQTRTLIYRTEPGSVPFYTSVWDGWTMRPSSLTVELCTDSTDGSWKATKVELLGHDAVMSNTIAGMVDPARQRRENLAGLFGDVADHAPQWVIELVKGLPGMGGIESSATAVL